MAVKNIIDGKQTSTIFKDTGLLADKCAGMVKAVIEGSEPEINDTETYDNGKMITFIKVDFPAPFSPQSA